MPKHKADHAYELLARVLAGTTPTADDIETLLRERVREGLHLDFKSGLEFVDEPGAETPGDPKKFHGKVRKFVAGFANSDGGLLVIGIREPMRRNPGTGEEERDPDPNAPRTVDGVKLPSDAAVLRVKEAVVSLRPYLSSAPRIHAIERDDGLVVVIAVPRSDALVVCLEANKTVVHYLRLHDSTVHAPGYLVEDIVLGRRRRPSVEVNVVQCELDGETLDLTLSIKNVGLVWLERTQVGLVCYSGGAAGPSTEVPEALRAGVDVQECAGLRTPLTLTSHSLSVTASMDAQFVAPFQIAYASTSGRRVLFPRGHEVWWAAAVYVVQHNQPPSWYQLGVEFAQHGSPRAYIVPVGERRPIIGAQGGARRDDWFRVTNEANRWTIELPNA